MSTSTTTPDHETMVRLLTSAFDAAPADKRDEWLTWYQRERNTVRAIAREHGITRRQAAGIVAVYSQNASWKGNLTFVRRFLADPEKPYGLRVAYWAARAILRGAPPLSVIKATKLRAFYRNLAGDDSALTIDRWAARAAGLADNPVGDAQYHAIADAYRTAAAQRQERPAALQAIVWCAVRGTGD